MRVDLKTLMSDLGVGAKLLHAYETQPWIHYDEEQGITCAAEVRAGPGMANIEAELQFLYDEPEKHNKTNPDQIILMRITPTNQGQEWQPHQMWVRGENYVNKIGGWDRKGCAFFKACVTAIKMEEVPDIDELIKKELADDSARGGRGRIGRKSPRANVSAIPSMGKKP